MLLNGSAPVKTVDPGTEEECADVVRACANTRLPAVPWGGGTAIHEGNRLRAEKWLALSTLSMNKIAEYSPADLVVTAQAGVTLASLQATLLDHGQFLPVDAPFDSRVTLGGIAATNRQGLWQPTYGLPRERLLGLRAVLPDGTVAKMGGKVVKNVAGYDLCKLFAGSWGTLGVITEVTFRTNPLPESRTTLCYKATSVGDALKAAFRLRMDRLEPTYAAVARADAAMLVVGLMGSAETVAWQRESMERVLVECGMQGMEIPVVEAAIRDLVANSNATTKARLSMLPTDLVSIGQELGSVASASLFHVHAGIAECAFDFHNVKQTDRVRGMLPPSARIVWTKVPDEWLHLLDVWGPVRSDFPVMRRIKEAIDPLGIFSPGRFVGRL